MGDWLPHPGGEALCLNINMICFSHVGITVSGLEVSLDECLSNCLFRAVEQTKGGRCGASDQEVTNGGH